MAREPQSNTVGTTDHSQWHGHIPARHNPSNRRLRELYGCNPQPGPDHTSDPTVNNTPLKDPLKIRMMDFVGYLIDSSHMYFRTFFHPDEAPGKRKRDKAYYFVIFPTLTAVLIFCKWVISLVIWASSYTALGKKLLNMFMDNEILLYDNGDFVNPEGNHDAVKLLGSRAPVSNPQVDYHITGLLLILSTMMYERDEKLVAQASKILENVRDEAHIQEASRLLIASEKVIDDKVSKQFGMRFTGASELKTLGAQFSGIFYNDDCVILTFKGTAVLNFNEYLLDATIQRLDASEYLYGEVHKGFYESLFPDLAPRDCYERATLDVNCPFDTIMEMVLEIARDAKSRTGKGINLWFTGHSMGGALAAMSMARLQKRIYADDPLYTRSRNSGSSSASASSSANHHHHARNFDPFKFFGAGRPASWTVLDEILSRRPEDKGLVNLRDCYSFASPRFGDSSFAQIFDQHQVQSHLHNVYKPTYWRVTTDMDIVPHAPPGCSGDSGITLENAYACARCGEEENKVKATIERVIDHNHSENHDNESDKGSSSDSESSDSDHSSSPRTRVNSGESSGQDQRTSKGWSLSLPWKKTSASIEGSEQQQQQQQSQKQGKSKHDLARKKKLHRHRRPSEAGTLVSAAGIADSIHSTTSNKPPKPMNSLLDYTHVGQLVQLHQRACRPKVMPTRYQSDFSSHSLRSKSDMLAALDYLQESSRILAEAKANKNQVTIEMPVAATETTSLLPKPSSTDKQKKHVGFFESQKVANDLDLAQEKQGYDDAAARLRVPCDAEVILLSFPNIISHSPSAYQRNLIAARYYFNTYPGKEYEARVEAIQSRGHKPQKAGFTHEHGQGVFDQIRTAFSSTISSNTIASTSTMNSNRFSSASTLTLASTTPIVSTDTSKALPALAESPATRVSFW